MRVIPLTSTGESVVEWALTFDCAPQDAEELTASFRDGVFSLGLRGLADYFRGTEDGCCPLATTP